MKPSRLDAKPTEAQLAGAQNAKNLLAKLVVLLDSGAQPSEATRAALELLRAALKDAF